ncbi:MAG: HD domain-containing protein [Ilumatobacteraceae bacterium]|nr:HD domain-containing protein [Ilumatobacteraceae bacterium]
MKQFSSIAEIIELYEQYGTEFYSEDVTQISHALQCATLAQESGAMDELVVAALLHDVGHLIDLAEYGSSTTAFESDAKHESIGAQSLAKLFPSGVTAPIALHVDAKRWRCATDLLYHGTLSSASVASLILQGGPMSNDEQRRFESHPQSGAAVQLRNWDDTGKALQSPELPLEKFVATLERVSVK